MNKITKSLGLLIILLAVLFAIYSFLDYGSKTVPEKIVRKCPPFVGYTKTETEYLYTSTIYGFSLQVPKGWFVAPATDTDPRVYNCGDAQGGASFGISGTEYDYAFAYYQKNFTTKKGKMYPDLIPGAIVVEYDMSDAETAPWGYWYLVVFEKEKKAFNLVTPGKIEDNTVIPTFKLIK